MPAARLDLYTLCPWLGSWFHPDRRALPGLEAASLEVFDALAAGWGREDAPALLEGCAARFGRARVLAVIDRVVAANARLDWAEVARAQGPGRNGVEDLARVLLRPLQADPAFQLTLEPRDGGLQTRWTRCPHAELGAAQGISEWIVHLVCGGDPHIVAGFNPRMGFRRTCMLAAGDEPCDHFYFLGGPAPA